MSLGVQFLTMAAMIGCGAALGLLFDGYRAVWGELRLPRRWHPPFDLLFWAAATAGVYRTLYLVNGGEVRFYVLLALLLGVSAYFALLSGVALRVLVFGLRAARRVFRFVRRLFRMTVVRPLLGLARALGAVFGFFASGAVFLGKTVLQWLKRIGKPGKR